MIVNLKANVSLTFSNLQIINQGHVPINLKKATQKSMYNCAKVLVKMTVFSKIKFVKFTLMKFHRQKIIFALIL